MNRRIMILGAGPLQVPAIEKAVAMGLDVVAVDRDPQAPGFSHAHHRVLVSTIDIDGVLAEACLLKPDGVMTLATDMPVRTLAAVAQTLKLPGMDPDTAIRVTDKGAMRHALAAAGVAIPDFFVVDDSSTYAAAAGQLDVPFIVKPADNSGSRGVTLVADRKHQMAAYAYSREHSRSGRVLVEAYMAGPEVSVEAFTVAGTTHILAVTDKITTHAPYFVEMGHTIPSRLPDDTVAAIHTLTRQAIAALGLTEGPSHTEIIITAQGPKIVEVGGRLGGDHITTHLVPLATGIDLVGQNIAFAVGDPVDLTPRFSRGAAIRYLRCAPGRIRQIYGVDIALGMPQVMEIGWTRQVGEWAVPVHNSADRVGFVICEGVDAEDAADGCEQAAQVIQIEIEETGE
jgi:biotin carboxylase